jgi:hypothetical protein
LLDPEIRLLESAVRGDRGDIPDTADRDSAIAMASCT